MRDSWTTARGTYKVYNVGDLNIYDVVVLNGQVVSWDRYNFRR